MTILKQFTYALQRAGIDYSETTAYLLGKPHVCPNTRRITAAFSTDNHLCNPYRCFRQGGKQVLCCDATYRLTDDEDQGLIIISTTDIGQHCHICAWGLVNKEDQAAHSLIFLQVRDAAEAVTEARARAGQRI
eukprot:2435015-Rhodomonas_salina.1